MNRFISSLLLLNLFGATNLPILLAASPAIAQPAANDLFYTYNGERIPLSIEPTAISAKAAGTRSSNDVPFASELQTYLDQSNLQSQRLKTLVSQADSKDTGRDYQVQAIGLDYALVTSSNRSLLENIKIAASEAPKTDKVLPVLTLNQSQERVILPNEILVSFEPTVSESQVQTTLSSQNLEILRPIAYSPNYFVVRSNSTALESSLNATNLDEAAQQILTAANQLRQAPGVTGVTPNFIPADTADFSAQIGGNRPDLFTPGLPLLESNADSFAASTQTASASLLPWQWHLNSSSLQHCLSLQAFSFGCLDRMFTPAQVTAPRTDLYALEAQAASNGGRGVVVAVLDTLVQTNHPNLSNSLYTANGSDKCPNEQHGWDYSSVANFPSEGTNYCLLGDSDPSINSGELTALSEAWKDTFKLNDQQWQQKHSETKESVFLNVITQFHGTMVSGVIAAKPTSGKRGVVGIAPNAQIMPVRTGVSKPIPSATVEAVAYAERRGANVVNMSITLTDEVFANRVKKALEDDRNLIIVASAGNRADRIIGSVSSSPAGIEGVVAVGATNFNGERAAYSQYGQGLDVVAPGGDIGNPNRLNSAVGGVMTTGGTFLDAFWTGIALADRPSPLFYDAKGEYIWIQGTSFSSPAVAGVFALMIGEDPQRKLTRDQLVEILKRTASYDRLKPLTQAEITAYSTAKQQGQTTATSAQEYYFGAGLVDAAAAVAEVKRVVQEQ